MDAAKTGWYQQLLAIKYPLIDFSLLSFQFVKGKETPISDYSAAWTQRVNSVNTAYSYIFIALIGFVYYIVVIIKLYKCNHFEKKYGLSTQFSNDYPIYDTKMYLGFVINLAIVFSFFNFLTTLIVLIYGVVLVLNSYFFWYILKTKTEVLVIHKWWKSPNFVLFTTI
ncbi:hypothetical protein [Spiroplasma endosymbiont of Nebria brevicollis]|uniref:hypothetical protein n=1 Tax=Spiroplasma endosymbiont of Nebria brevicollis TaxID=3066284 RepID=UPI00313F1C23